MTTRVLDLFCGAGGSSQGAVQAGTRLVGAIDSWDIATATIKDNHPDAWVETERLHDGSRPSAALIERGVDLLLASPECTNHSPAKGNKPRCTESRRSGSFVLNYLRDLSPKWAIFENVTQMRSWEGYEDFLRNLAELGYGVTQQIFEASHFAVPQSRRRLFILCEKGRAPDPVPVGRGSVQPAARFIELEGRWKSRPLHSAGRAQATLDRANRAMAALGTEVPFLIVYYGSDGAGGWQSLDRPIRTLTTLDRFGLVTWRGTEPYLRMLQVDELRDAMGFPRTYRFAFGTRRDKVKLLGNGVCPPVMEAIVRHLTGETRELPDPGIRDEILCELA